MTMCREVHISQVKEGNKKEKNLMKEKDVMARNTEEISGSGQGDNVMIDANEASGQ